MSLNQANSAVARSRSLRVPAKALTAPQSVSTTVTPAQMPTSTSNIALFLTNLRLLDLDLEPDWPGITLATFSAKDAAGGQKKRIQCVEWALYQLFTLWDYAETQNKLRPFFPPLDQVQSINLRAALLRGLEQAKKNGVLGRDAVIRKTMLDECKGERFEEVLAVFSSAVLKKLVSERALNSGTEYRPTISENLALEKRGYSGDRTSLNALLLAHKISLRSHLTKKNAARTKYRDFEELLALKERGIARRREQIKVETERGIAETSERAKSEVYRIIKTNWTGNEQWVDSLLFNDTNPRKGGLLGSRFDDVWAGVQEGRISDLEDQNVGLLEQLDSRVRHQRARLEKWDDFRKKMFGSMPPPRTENAKEKAKPKGADLRFTAHRNLQIDKTDTKDQTPFSAPPPHYARILDNMKAELEVIGKPKVPDFSSFLGALRSGSVVDNASYATKPEANMDPISDISDWEDEKEVEVLPVEQPPKPSVTRPLRLAPPKASGLEPRRRIPKPSSIEISSNRYEEPTPRVSTELESPELALPSRPSIPAPTRSLSYRHKSTRSDVTYSSIPSYRDSRDISPIEPPPSKAVESMPPPPLPISPTQAMADEILASMSNASPSPMKKHRHTLSLAERTRMSMSRTRSYEKEDEAPHISPTKLGHTGSSSEDISTSSVPPPAAGEEHEDLLARTRRSMAGFEAAQKKAQLERRRSQRKSKMAQRKDSYFPRLEEEDGGVGDASIAEELIEAGAEDYEAVFKSRPRIQTSPLPSPTKTWDGE
ncbi:HAUS augmin-like complex subunit 6 N-terminus-domain-containing protein [Hypoxylon sp. FL1150]|nr:HAUS augmin-like complex subunit 6 N-terminus-domain-containing protein [Hypoxylon sp. FL1150]